MKRCSKCGETKPRGGFQRHSKNRDGCQTWCKACVRRRFVRLYATPEGRLLWERSRLKHLYGLTPEERGALLASQGGTCRLYHCTSPATDVDHDHTKTKSDAGFVRGLLCRPHNRGMGFFKDDPVLLADAILYLRGEPKEKPPDPSGG